MKPLAEVFTLTDAFDGEYCGNIALLWSVKFCVATLLQLLRKALSAILSITNLTANYRECEIFIPNNCGKRGENLMNYETNNFHQTRSTNCCVIINLWYEGRSGLYTSSKKQGRSSHVITYNSYEESTTILIQYFA